MRSLEFDSSGFEDLAWWIERDRNQALRIVKLIREVQRDPFAGIGKPEPLKRELETFIDCVEKNLPFPITPEQAIRNLEFCEKVRASI